MIQATQTFLKKLDETAKARREAILRAPDQLNISGQKYYVSAEGCDDFDGKTPETAWKTLKRVSEAELASGDGVLFRRGDLFRGQLLAKRGVSYGAYGQGDKPRLYAWDWDLADPLLWEIADAENRIWHCTKTTLDAGTLVFDGGKRHSRKLIPSYLNGKFVCRDHPEIEFDMRKEMTQDLDLFCRYDETLTEEPSKGENFPIPKLGPDSFGDLYLRCDEGNPGEIFYSIELLAKRHLIVVADNENVHIDNLCLRYTGEHAIAASGLCVKGLHVTNCEIGWIGGSIQNYAGTDPNYPQGGRGTVTRYGNGVEIYGGCEDYEVSNCWVYQVYDAGITHQISTFGKEYRMEQVCYRGNLVEKCVYSIEYFLEKTEPNDSIMSDIEICDNILRFSGYGWGNQRHNKDTPAHIKGWSYENTAMNYRIHDNLLDRAGKRMLHLVAKDGGSLPQMSGNVYVQTKGMILGQYGANEVAEPPILTFDEHAEQHIIDEFGDKGAQIYFVEESFGQ